MKVADTSFLVAFFDADDSRHAAARDELAKADTVRVPTEILVETLAVIKHKADLAAARKAAAALMAIPQIQWQESCDLPAAYAIYREEKRLSLPDAIVVHSCLQAKAACLTFDERQAQAIKQRSGR